MIKLGPFNANANLNNRMTTAAFNAPANMADFLFHSTEIFLKPSAAGQIFKVDFPEIAQASAVPEPSTLMMAAVALPLGIAHALRSRSRGLRNAEDRLAPVHRGFSTHENASRTWPIISIETVHGCVDGAKRAS